MNILNNILHCTSDGSDKVYIIWVDEMDDNTFLMTTFWGAREAKRLSSQTQQFTTRFKAMNEAQKIANRKLSDSGGYVYANKKIKIPALEEAKKIAGKNKINAKESTEGKPVEEFRAIQL